MQIEELEEHLREGTKAHDLTIEKQAKRVRPSPHSQPAAEHASLLPGHSQQAALSHTWC